VTKSVLDKIMDTIIVLLTTLTAVMMVGYSIAQGHIAYLKKNWPAHRCNPIYMPLAGLVGQDVFNNFTKCTMKGFHDYAGFMMDPLVGELDSITDVVGDIGDAVHDMRGMMSSTRGGFMGITGMVFGKIFNTMSSIQYIIIRMRTLMGRVMGIMMSFVLMFSTGMQSAESVNNGPIMRMVRAL
jgi:hypothetical protein